MSSMTCIVFWLLMARDVLGVLKEAVLKRHLMAHALSSTGAPKWLLKAVKILNCLKEKSEEYFSVARVPFSHHILHYIFLRTFLLLTSQWRFNMEIESSGDFKCIFRGTLDNFSFCSYTLQHFVLN